MKHKNKRGTVTVESAIAFTITIVFIAAIVSAIDYYRTDILMRRSVEQTCEKMSLLYPVSVPASDLISSAVNAFPDLGIGKALDQMGLDVGIHFNKGISRQLLREQPEQERQAVFGEVV